MDSSHPTSNRGDERRQKEAELKSSKPAMFRLYRRYSRTLSDHDAIEFFKTDFDEAALSIALACLQRLVRLWGFVATSFVKQRYTDDERHYQMLRSNIMLMLRLAPDYEDLERNAQEAIPESLPTIGDMIDMVDVPEIEFSIDNQFRHIEAEIIRRAIESWIEVDVDRYDQLLVMHDQYIDKLESPPEESRPKDRGADALTRSAQADDLVGQTTTSRAGRHRKDLSYEDAQRLWWEMVRDLGGEPLQREIVERLASEGRTMSIKTLQRRIANWHKQNLPWPPPPLADD